MTDRPQRKGNTFAFGQRQHDANETTIEVPGGRCCQVADGGVGETAWLGTLAAARERKSETTSTPHDMSFMNQRMYTL